MPSHGHTPDDFEPDDEDSGRSDNGGATNPFAGTPLEPLFAQFSGGQMPDMSTLMSQMQRMFTPHDGSVDLAGATDVARHVSAGTGPDPTPNDRQAGALRDAVSLAEMWLDRATSIPAGATTSAVWSRADWIENTADTWHTLVEPIAEHVVSAMSDALPDEIKAVAGPLVGMLGQAGTAMFTHQLGQSLGNLSTEVITSTDIGLPLGPDRVAAVLPEGVKSFGQGLEVSDTDVLLYLVLRECAHHRLFRHAPWLQPALVTTIAEFGRGTRIDMAGIEEKLTSIDPTRPDELSEAMAGGLFDPAPTPEQSAALARLELLLALIDGWVEEVVGRATAETMPSTGALAEAMRRRRAAGGPAELTFTSLVGLHQQPRRLRDAANLWAAVRDRNGAEARDRIWSHPDLLPTAADIDDPLGFAERDTDEVDEAISRFFDDLDE